MPKSSADLSSELHPRRIASGLADLSPANFAIVMATGIVSLAAYLHDLHGLASALLWFNLAAWAALWLLNLARVLIYPTRWLGDMVDHQRGPGFFTVVAGTAVLAAQALVIRMDYSAALALALLAAGLWVALTYVIFTALTVKQDKLTLEKGISGTWLLVVVATQSLAVAGALLAPQTAEVWRPELNFLALSMWLAGGMLYIWIMTLIFYRCLFFPLPPDNLTPPYWINMGAMAISTLAGSLLISNAVEAPLLASLLPFLKGMTLLYWAVGSWWVPLLLLLGAWRYLYRRFPVRYDPLYWGVVFPLGMYSASTHEMVQVMALDFLAWLPPLFLYASILAWSAVLAGLAWQLSAGLTRGSRIPPGSAGE